MTTVKREFRKPYMVDMPYEEMMRSTWDKSIWNQILEVDPVWAEFLFTRAELPNAATAAEERYLRYVRQSEFKKAFGDFDYPEMEYLWNGPIPGVFPPDFGFDFPWMPKEGGGVWPPGEGPPYGVLCDANTDGCYCPGQNKDIVITATYPIVSVAIVHGEGEYFTDIQGIGTNSVTVIVNTPAARVGQMRFRVWMTYAPGKQCDSEINVYECPESECCPGTCTLAWNWDASDETIAAPGSANVFVSGGTGPFSWSISSEDGEWSLQDAVTPGGSNTVLTTAAACGAGTITVTDACGCTTTGSVRNPASGSWNQICAATPPVDLSCCYFGGVPNDVAWTQNGPNNWDAYSIQGKYRQYQKDYNTCAAKGYGSIALCNSDGDYRNCGGMGIGVTCLTRNNPWDNPRFQGASCANGANPLNQAGNQWYKTPCITAGRCDCCVYLGQATSILRVYEWLC